MLVNLAELKVIVRGGSTAEEVCGQMLHPGMLEERGTLVDLVLVAGPETLTPFNVIRAISPLCAEEARISVGQQSGIGRHEVMQGQFLQNLRK